MNRRCFLMLGVLVWATACGGAPASLTKLGAPTGNGPAEVEIVNGSGEQISNLYLALSSSVKKARLQGVEPGSPGDIELWGEDLLGQAGLRKDSSFRVSELVPDRYDVLVTDPAGREQLIRGLKLEPGGRYRLKLTDRWQRRRM